MIKLLIKINLMRMLSPRKKVKGAPRTGGGGKGLVVAYALVAVLMLLAFGAMASGIAIGLLAYVIEKRLPAFD